MEFLGYLEDVEFRRVLEDEEVDGAALRSLTNQKIMENFPSIKFGQRDRLIKYIEQLNASNSPTGLQNPDNPCPSVSAAATHHSELSPTIAELASDLGCCDLDGVPAIIGVINEDAEITFLNSTVDDLDINSIPLMSSSIIAKKNVTSKGNKRTYSTRSPRKPQMTTKEIDVQGILSKSAEGRRVVNFLKKAGTLDFQHRSLMLEILCKKILPSGASPKSKYYPNAEVKHALAQAIVAAFPELADEDGSSCSFFDPETHTGFISNKLNYMVQKFVSPSKRRYRPRKAKTIPEDCDADGEDEEHPKKRKKTKNSCASEVPVGVTLNDEEFKAKVQWLKNVEPLGSLKGKISEALDETFTNRRTWILESNPTYSDVVDAYKHLVSFGGDMIDEEFRRIYPHHKNLVEACEDAIPAVLNYAALTNKTSYEKAGVFTNVHLKFIVLLCDILPAPIAGRNGLKGALKNELQTNKEHLTKMPSSALMQIIEEGHDVDSYESVERICSVRARKPIYPFILYLTNEPNVGGECYIKVDRQSIHVAARPNTNHVLRAVEVLFKIYHVFNLKYHVYLNNLFQLLEYFIGINDGKFVPSVSILISALKNYKQIESSLQKGF